MRNKTEKFIIQLRQRRMENDVTHRIIQISADELA